MSNQSLTDLCGICYTEKPKYRCPRCQAKTCSLPCYKKHQQRASCNGQRDPAKFIKKSQWATPSGIDRDYNYLKTIERSIDHAGQDTYDRGIGIARQSSERNVARAWRDGSQLQKYLAQHNITVQHAPMGMTRQKTNRTRATNSGNILWTLEWIYASGERTLEHECAESNTVTELYDAMREKARKAELRKAATTSVDASLSRGKKRKRANQVLQDHSADDRTVTVPEKSEEEPTAAVTVETVDAQSHQNPQEQKMSAAASIETELEDQTVTLIPSPPTSLTAGPQQQQSQSTPSLSAALELNPPNATASTQPLGQSRSFYLLKPSTSSSAHVLIPLDPNATLTQSLQGRSVQEYPTIYVLEYHEQDLPDAFVTEEAYLKRQRREEVELKALTRHTNRSLSQSELQVSARQDDGEVLDAQSILNMLKRDVRA